jgi:hypothetical protein
MNSSATGQRSVVGLITIIDGNKSDESSIVGNSPVSETVSFIWNRIDRHGNGGGIDDNIPCHTHPHKKECPD